MTKSSRAHDNYLQSRAGRPNNGLGSDPFTAPALSDDDAAFDVPRICAIHGEIEDLLEMFLRVAPDPGGLRRAAYAEFRADIESLWRIVMFEARAAGVSASEVRALLLRRAIPNCCDKRHTSKATYGTVAGGYRTFEEVSRLLRRLAQDQIVNDATAKRQELAASRVNGRKGGSKPKPEAKDLKQKISALTSEYRRSRPYHRHRASTDRLAVFLAGELDKNPDTIKRHLRTLGLK